MRRPRRLTAERERREAGKLALLRRAAEEGWAAVAAGRYVDLSDDELDEYIAGLGKRPRKPAVTD